MATKRTRKAVIKAKILVENIFKFKKLPICPPIKTTASKIIFATHTLKTMYQ